MVEIRVHLLRHPRERRRVDVEDLDVPELRPRSAGGDGEASAVAGGRGGEGVQPRRGDPRRARDRASGYEVLRKVGSEDAPPPVVGLAVEEDGGVASPGRPPAALGDHRPRCRVGHGEHDDVGTEIVEVAGVPWPAPVGRDGDEPP